MNHQSNRPRGARGRRQLPAANLTSRAGACRILGMTKRQLAQLEDDAVLLALLQPAVVEVDGVRWFNTDALRRLAESLRKMPVVEQGAAGRRARPSSPRLLAKARPGTAEYTPPVSDYYPEEDKPIGGAKSRRVLPRHPTPPRGPETPPTPAPLAPSVRSKDPADPPRLLTQVPDSWFTSESIPTWPRDEDDDD